MRPSLADVIIICRGAIEQLARSHSEVVDATGGREPTPDDSLTPSSVIERARARASHQLTWPTAGITLARYVLRRRLGFGGMGQVWAAWDGELAREVAIKVVRLRDAKNAKVSAERLAREARALARLSDPMVVQVFDVGSYETTSVEGERIHGVFVVMELVRGSTLSGWLAAEPRSTTEIVRVFLAAGRGLAAAHAAGLVHRDIKPSNIFLRESSDDTGPVRRVLIGDFGLARAVASSGSGFASPAAAVEVYSNNADDETLSGSLTDTGTVVGTLPYMAPEQHRGTAVDVRSDQYAFCVALYEALFQVRPFSGALEDVMHAKCTRTPAEPEHDLVPRAIREIVWRGLAPSPEDRWPEMAELVAALERAIAPRPRPTWKLTALAALGLAVVIGAAVPDGREERCESIGDAMWTDDRRLLAAEHGSSVQLVERYVAEIDALQTELCRDSAAAHAPELQCLRRAAREIDEVLTVLEEPGRSPDLARLLDGAPDVDACRLAVGDANQEIDERDRLVVDAELRKLSRGEALWRTERNHEALAIGEAVLAAIEDGRVPRDHLRAPALLLVGKALDGLGSAAPAEVALTDAYFTGKSRGDAETAFEAGRVLAGVLAEQRRHGDAETWLRHAEVELAKLPPTPVLAARLANSRGGSFTYAGDLDRAVAEFRRGVSACPIDGCSGGSSLALNLAGVLYRLGELDEARGLRLAVLDAMEARHGSDSPASVQVRLELSHELLAAGRIDAAEGALRVAERLIDRWLDENHWFRVVALDQRAEILLARADPAGAVELIEKSLAIVDRSVPEDDLRRATRLNDLGYAYFASGRSSDALAVYAKARAFTERVDPSSIEHGGLLASMGHVKGELGDYEGALADLRDARRTLEPLLGADHPYVVLCDTNEARVLMRSGRSADALPLWESAAARLESLPLDDRSVIDLDISYAQCLVDLDESEHALAVLDRHAGAPFQVAGQRATADYVRAQAILATDPIHAVSLARAARDELADLPSAYKVESIDVWIAKHASAAARAAR